MLNEQLLAYVRENTNAGFKRADIEAALKSSGWDVLDITAAFSAITGVPPPQTRSATPSASPLSDQQSINSEVSRFRALSKQSKQKNTADPAEAGIIGFMLRNNLVSSKETANIVLIMCALLCGGLALWMIFR